MLNLENNCMKETIGNYEISVAFNKRHGWGDMRVFDNRTNEDVTRIVFGRKNRVDASIDNLTHAKYWCETHPR